MIVVPRKIACNTPTSAEMVLQAAVPPFKVALWNAKKMHKEGTENETRGTEPGEETVEKPVKLFFEFRCRICFVAASNIKRLDRNRYYNIRPSEVAVIPD